MIRHGPCRVRPPGGLAAAGRRLGHLLVRRGSVRDADGTPVRGCIPGRGPRHARRQGPRAAASVAPDARVPPAMDAVVLRALAKQPGERFQSARELRRALDRATALTDAAVAIISGTERTVLATPPAPRRRSSYWMEVPIIAAALLMLVGHHLPARSPIGGDAIKSRAIASTEAPPPTSRSRSSIHGRITKNQSRTSPETVGSLPDCSLEKTSRVRKIHRWGRLSGSHQSADPIAGTPSLVGDRKDANHARELDECYRVRKPSGSCATNSEVGCDTRVEGKPAGAASHRGEHSVDLCQELTPEAFTPLLVPCHRSGKLLLRLRFDPDGFHSRRSFDSISARAADQSSPPSGSDSTRRARRSISATQASSASASLGPSKLATNSSATSARSSSVRSRASPSTFWARPLMDSNVLGRSAPDQASGRNFVP
jgi:hypothetical protein